MNKANLLVAALILPSVAMTGPAQADEPVDCDGEVVVGYNDGLYGSATVDCTHDDGEGTFYRVTPECTFAGVLTPSNTLIVEYGGSAVISTNDLVKVPQLTRVRCVIRQGALEAGEALQFNGPAAAVASSTLLNENGPKEWPVSDITICAEGVGVFGNIDPVIVRIPLTCVTPTP